MMNINKTITNNNDPTYYLNFHKQKEPTMKLYELTDTLEFKHLVIENIDSCISMYFSYLNVDDILKLYADNDIHLHHTENYHHTSQDGNESVLIVPLGEILDNTNHICTIGLNSTIQLEIASSFLDIYTKIIPILRDEYEYDITDPTGVDQSLYVDSLIGTIQISRRDFNDNMLNLCCLPIDKIELFEDSF